MLNYKELKSTDPLHITNFRYTSIEEIARMVENEFKSIGKDVDIIEGEATDTVQLDKRNEPDFFIEKYWSPRTTLKQGISKVFASMKEDYDKG